MATNQSKLEQLCDIITEDIMNDIEQAKTIIEEYNDNNISYAERMERIKDIQYTAFKNINKNMIHNTLIFCVNSQSTTNITSTVFDTIKDNNNKENEEVSIKINCVRTYKINSRSRTISTINEDHLQLN